MEININKIIIFLFLLFFKISSLFCENINLDAARYEFLEGNYELAIEIAGKINSPDAQVFQSRVLSIHTHFFKEGDEAKKHYLKAYEIVSNILNKNKNHVEANVEAAHALGRYGQEIGILSAISEGIADRVKSYLNTALKINNDNIIANISKGIWHAEIINQAGKTLGSVIYGASARDARNHFQKVYSLNNSEISILYELSYGYYLLGEKEDLLISIEYLKKLLSMKNKSHLDQLYKKKAIKLKKAFSINN